MSVHFRLSPSGAERWASCPVAPRREDGIPDTHNVHAIEGTFAHALAAHCLRTDTNPVAYYNKRGAEFLSTEEMHGYLTEDYGDAAWASEHFDQLRVNTEMLTCIGGYVQHVRSLVGTDGIMLVEQHFDLSDVLGEPAGGTGDAVVLHEGHLQVVDLKYGRKRVHAAGNKQLLLYALGAKENVADMLGYAVEQVTATIYQPRIDHVDSVTISAEELAVFRDEIGHAARATRDENATAKPGGHCYWCKAKAVCREHAVSAMGEVVQFGNVEDSDFEALVDSLPDNAIPPELLSTAELAKVKPLLPFIREWCDAVDAQLMSAALAGETVPGYKLVAGKRGARCWASDTLVEKTMRGPMRVPAYLAYKHTLITPAQAEKILKPKKYKRLAKFVVQPPGKPTLVVESDPREPIQVGAADSEFETSN